MVLAVASLLTHLKSIERGVVLIDGNNVRGADRFALSQQALCDRVAEWAAVEQLPSILVLDHGEQRAWPLGEFAVCTLSGDVQTADDVCVRDALWLRQRGRGVAVATSDVELTRRLRLRRGVRGATEVVSSSAFLQRALLVGDEADGGGAPRGEGTAERQASALALAAHLDEVAAPPSFDDDAEILAEYVRWVEEEAPREVRRHADPEAVVRGSKRRARRVRARKAAG